MKGIYIARSLGCVYWMENGELYHAPTLSNDDFCINFENDGGAVDAELVGGETVFFQDTYMTLNEVYAIVKKKLTR
jgi:hypothetical protein